MPIALHTAGLPPQSHQGVGARLVRRLGGAVHSAIVSGITLAGTLRRPAVSQTSRDHAAARAPTRRSVRVPRRPRTAFPAPLLLPRLLACLLTRRHRRPAAASRPQGYSPFTPEACPQLTPKACAVLNTPLKDCDPKTLEVLFSALAQHINELMSPEAGMTDPRAALPNLWYRLSAALGDIKPETSSPTKPEAVPTIPGNAVPDGPLVPPHPPAPPTRRSAKASAPLSGPPASDRPPDATITTAAPETTPDVTAPSRPLVEGGRPLANFGRSFRCCAQSLARRCRRPFQGSSQPWRLCYAACTGPPSGIACRTRRTSPGNERGHRTAAPPVLIRARRSRSRFAAEQHHRARVGLPGALGETPLLVPMGEDTLEAQNRRAEVDINDYPQGCSQISAHKRHEQGGARPTSRLRRQRPWSDAPQARSIPWGHCPEASRHC